MRTIHEPAREVPVVAEADVVVAGGGPGGLPAAIAAARHGARVILIERYGFLGGLATAGLVVPILGHTASGHIMPLRGQTAKRSTAPIVEGLLRETIERMHALGGAPDWHDACQHWGIRFNAECLKLVADEMAQEAGVELFLHTLVTGGVVENGQVRAIIVENKSGRQAIACRMAIDATGDADLAFRCGATTRQGRDFDGRVMATGSFFHLGGLPLLSEEQKETVYQFTRQALMEGRMRLFSPRFTSQNSFLTDHSTCNMTRWPIDPTNAHELTKAEVDNRRTVWQLLAFIKDEVNRTVPGFENTYVRQTAAQIGPRQSRQVIGPYLLSGEDVRQGRKFADGVARGSWWVDIHCPFGFGYPVSHCMIECPKGTECPYYAAEYDQLLHERDIYPPQDDWYDIPYRCLTALGFSNLLVSGRCISATMAGMSSTRVMGTCMAIGQAAGTAAAIAARDGVSAEAVDIAVLRTALRADGVLL